MKTILLVEDDQNLADGLVMNLEADGYQVVRASDGSAVNDNASCAGGVQPHGNTQRGGLSASRRPQKRNDFAGLGAERYAVQCPDRANIAIGA